jgi:hypothetical protein
MAQQVAASQLLQSIQVVACFHLCIWQPEHTLHQRVVPCMPLQLPLVRHKQLASSAEPDGGFACIMDTNSVEVSRQSVGPQLDYMVMFAGNMDSLRPCHITASYEANPDGKDWDKFITKPECHAL